MVVRRMKLDDSRIHLRLILFNTFRRMLCIFNGYQKRTDPQEKLPDLLSAPSGEARRWPTSKSESIYFGGQLLAIPAHMGAARAAMSGIDLVPLAAMLGHSRIQMVLRYAHPTHQHQHQAMVRLEQYVSEQRIADAERTAAQTLIRDPVTSKRGESLRESLQFPLHPYNEEAPEKGLSY